MPVDPTYAHADTPHEKTIAGPDWRYGCHSRKTGEQQRGKPSTYCASPWAHGGVRIETDWIPKNCGHTLRGTDPACTGCVNRSEDHG